MDFEGYWQENKRFVAQPVLCDGDGPIARFRDWSAQFHGEARS